jgi:hypothetical protein
MAGSSVIVALNAVSLKRLRLPDHPGAEPPAAGARGQADTARPAAQTG